MQRLYRTINFDGIGTEVYGPVKRIVGFGAEHSDLGAVFEDVTAATGNIVTPDPMPEENAFVRSDHYAFVKKGVPLRELSKYRSLRVRKAGLPPLFGNCFFNKKERGQARLPEREINLLELSF